MDLLKYIENWISIENIATKQFSLKNPKFERQFLDNSKFINKDGTINDPCNKYSEKECIEEEQKVKNCSRYYSSREEKYICVNKYRIKNFEGSKLAQSVRGKLGEKFKIIDTFPYTHQKDSRLKQTIYCHILTHEKDKTIDLYILFNTGSILNANLLWDQPFIKIYLQPLYEKYILKYQNLYQKVVLCGHSMGAVLALRLGYYAFVNNRQLFDNQVIVVGGGPFQWFLKGKDKQFFNSKNIVIFLNGSEYKGKWSVDPIIRNLIDYRQQEDENYQNPHDFIVYYPLKAIDNSTYQKSGILEMTQIQEYSDDFYSIVGIDHSWEGYYKIIRDYINYMRDQNITWGLGIEHETMIYHKSRSTQLGKVIKNHIYNSIPNLGENVDNLLQDDLRYEILDTLEISHDLIDKVASGRVVTKLLENDKGSKILRDWYQKWYQKRSQNEKDKLFVDERDTYRNLLYDITDEKAVSLDFTNETTVIEFKTIEPKRQKIKEYIYQLNLQQELILKGIELRNNLELKYPTIGSVFPLKCRSQYCIDYTGSYHLNISLPYSKTLLAKEEKIYQKNHNLIDEYLEAVGNDFSELGFDLTNQEIKSYLPEELASQKVCQNELSNIDKKLDEIEYLLNYYYQDSTSSIVNLSNYYFRLRYNEYHKLKQIFIYFFLGENASKIFSVIDDKLVSVDDNLILPIEGEIEEIFKIMKSIPIEEYEKYVFTFRDKGLVKTPYKLIGQYFTKSVIDKIKLAPVIEIETTKLDRFLDGLNRATHLFFNKSLPKIMKITYNNLNNISNLYFKYQTNFHHYHKILAVALQIILPLIIGVYGSVDPLSISGNPKLTEGSLRTFISGYSFVNMCNVLDYNLPDTKEIFPYQQQPTSLNKVSDQFLYWDKTGYPNIKGSEFRVDPNHGFDFGFELRVFDNFPIEDLENVIELVFLLADHLYDEKIFETGFPHNPYDNKIVTDQLVEILGQGWNTRVYTDYIRFINHNLQLKVIDQEGQNVFEILNEIYQQLQQKYVVDERGHFSRFLIDKRTSYLDLKNINRLSWEINFKRLVWEPNEEFRMIIQILRDDYPDDSEFIIHLSGFVKDTYGYNTKNVVYALESLGLLNRT